MWSLHRQDTPHQHSPIKAHNYVYMQMHILCACTYMAVKPCILSGLRQNRVIIPDDTYVLLAWSSCHGNDSFNE